MARAGGPGGMSGGTHEARAIAAFAFACAATLAVAQPPPPDRLDVGPFSRAAPGGPLPEGWGPLTFPRIARHTRYALVRDPDRGTVVEAVAEASASGLVRKLDAEPNAWPVLSWSWKIERPVAKGDVTRRSGDDYAARVYVTFRVPPERLSPFERMRRTAVAATFGDDAPDAGLVYIWDARSPVGTIVPNAYTDRVRMIVVESGSERAGRWLAYERDLAADYRAAFGGDAPSLSGVAIMTDTDNTGESLRAWYGDIALARAPAVAKPAPAP